MRLRRVVVVVVAAAAVGRLDRRRPASLRRWPREPPDRWRCAATRGRQLVAEAQPVPVQSPAESCEGFRHVVGP